MAATGTGTPRFADDSGVEAAPVGAELVGGALVDGAEPWDGPARVERVDRGS